MHELRYSARDANAVVRRNTFREKYALSNASITRGDIPMTITRRHLLQTTSASALLASLGQSVFAQSQAFPFETARLITGFAAGGTSDTTCRRVATRLQPDYGRAVVVENRTGAGGQIAVTYVKS